MLIKNCLARVTSLIKSKKLFNLQSRLYTSDVENFEVIRDRKKDYVILKMNRAPVNSFDTETMKDLGYQFEIFEEDPNIKGVIITSDLPVFSGGLNLMALYQSERHHSEQLWTAVQRFYENLYGSQKCYIAAINGHCMALGCLLAISCDWRVMGSEENIKIGLSATRLGISPPNWIKDTMVNTIGHREAELALELGKRYNPHEALKIGLVDELVPKKNVLEAAEHQMNKWLQIPSEARGLTKKLMRQETLNRFKLNRQSDLDDFVSQVDNPGVQEAIRNYLQGLKNQHKYLGENIKEST